MLNRQSADNLFGTSISADAPHFIIYSTYLSKRLSYTCRFIFETVLKCSFEITSNTHVFDTSNLVKLNYSKHTFEKVACIYPDNLLFETAVVPQKPESFVTNDLVYLYRNVLPRETTFHFDVFAAVFYMISRYEEWQPFKSDKHLRFEAGESILFKNKCHLKPVVDIWINEFRSFLQSIHPELKFPATEFRVMSTLDVDNLFAYKHKGFLRTTGALLKDVLKADFRNFKSRIKTLTGKTADPFDVYDEVTDFCNAQGIPILWFFLMRTGTEYDRTVSPSSEAFKNVFRRIKHKVTQIGLHPSYNAAYEAGRLEAEHRIISQQLNETVTISRQHFLRFDIRTTPGLLLKQGIKTDFSMGFASQPGFRAGTSHPFHYFNFSKNEESELLFVPFCTMDGAYFVYDQVEPEKALASMLSLAAEIKEVGGNFISVFHERTFSDHLYPGFGGLYKNLHLRLKEL